MVAAHEHEHEPASLGDDRERLQQCAGGHAELARDVVDRRRAGRVHALGLGQRVGQRDRPARRRSRPRRSPRSRARARRRSRRRAHGAMYSCAPKPPIIPTSDSTLYHSRPQRSKMRSYARGVGVVGDVEPRPVAVERVGVLHDELARAQHARARARLVALLGLEVVEAERQVAVGAHELGDVQRHALLVRHREHHVGALAVCELEQLVDLVAARAPPRVGRHQDRHQQLLAADRVELLADDLLDLAVHAPAGRQPRPQPRADLADEAGADHELVRQGLGVGGRLAFGGQQELAESGHG